MLHCPGKEGEGNHTEKYTVGDAAQYKSARCQNRQFPASNQLPLSLKNFITFHNIPLQAIYKRATWSKLCQLANQLDDLLPINRRRDEAHDPEKVALL
jgi:hypothetical protein